MGADLPPFDPATALAELQRKTVAMNEALILGSVRQHELTEAAERLNAQLQLEIAARQAASRELMAKARLLDLSNDAIIVRDYDNKITLWSNGAERLYGWASEDAVGKDLHSLLQEELSEGREEIETQLRQGGLYIGEAFHTARDGRRIPSLCRSVLDEETKSILTSYTDITERHLQSHVEDAQMLIFTRKGD